MFGLMPTLPDILSKIMKIRLLIASIIFAGLSFGATAETKSAKSAVHLKAHREQLANAKSKLDKSVISGFIDKDILSREESENALSAESSSMINDLLSEARSHIGKRYVHGSKGPNAFDCSGFTSYVYKQFGYSISPSSRTQFTQGTPVDRNKLRKGDLVFFTSRSSGRNVGHVGIVVKADNETGNFSFIHASIKGVQINDCKGYYEGRFVGAKRIITE